MTERVIVALTGSAGSGKTTVAKYLNAAYGCEVISISTSLRAELANAISRGAIPGIQASDARYVNQKPTRASIRRLLQHWGDFMRAIYGGHYYISRAIAAIDTCFSNIVIDDLRYTDEALMLSDCFPQVRIIRVDRDQKACAKAAPGAAGHPSEDGIPEQLISAHLHNRGSLEDLKQQIEAVIGPLFRGRQ